MKETLSDNELTLKEINELLPIDSNTKFYAGEVIKQFIKDNIGCGIDIGGIPCGESVDTGEFDENGNELFTKKFYCDRCNKLIKEAGNKLI